MNRFRILITAFVLTALAPAAHAATPGTGTHYVYLIRHGIYDRDSTADDVAGNGLNLLGRQQARLVGARLAALPVRPASLVSSPYRRARETAEDIGRALRMKPTLDSLIHECTPTSNRADYMRSESPEEFAACDANLERAWSRYAVPTPDADRHDILVCHGNVIRWFVSRAVAGDPVRWPSLDIANASITILAVRPDGSVRLVMFSDIGHVPVGKQTWTGKGAGWSTPPPR